MQKYFIFILEINYSIIFHRIFNLKIYLSFQYIILNTITIFILYTQKHFINPKKENKFFKLLIIH